MPATTSRTTRREKGKQNFAISLSAQTNSASHVTLALLFFYFYFLKYFFSLIFFLSLWMPTLCQRLPEGEWVAHRTGYLIVDIGEIIVRQVKRTAPKIFHRIAQFSWAWKWNKKQNSGINKKKRERSFHHMDNTEIPSVLVFVDVNWRVFLKYLSLLELKVPVERLSTRLVVLATDDGTVAAKVHWIMLPMTWPLTEFTEESAWREKIQMAKGTMSLKNCTCQVWVVRNISEGGGRDGWLAHSSNRSHCAVNCQEAGLTSGTLVRAPLLRRAGMNSTTPLLSAQT